MAATSYIFQIELPETEGMPSAALAGEKLSALVIEVQLRNAGSPAGEGQEAERAAAEAVARVAAAEALGDAILQGSESVRPLLSSANCPNLYISASPTCARTG